MMLMLNDEGRSGNNDKLVGLTTPVIYLTMWHIDDWMWLMSRGDIGRTRAENKSHEAAN